jgi:hypothetical protein
MPRSRIVALAALIVLAAGAWFALRPFLPRRPLPPPTAAELANPGEDVVARAMKDAPVLPPPVDSTEYKQRWLDEVKDVDLAGLSGRQREIFLRFANAERCTCGCGYTLAGCRASDMTCEVSGPHLEALLDSVRTGKIRSAAGLRTRPGRAG